MPLYSSHTELFVGRTGILAFKKGLRAAQILSGATSSPPLIYRGYCNQVNKSFFWCIERINFFFIIFNDSVFEQPSGTNCVREPKFDCSFFERLVHIFIHLSFPTSLHSIKCDCSNLTHKHRLSNCSAINLLNHRVLKSAV